MIALDMGEVGEVLEASPAEPDGADVAPVVFAVVLAARLLELRGAWLAYCARWGTTDDRTAQ